MTTLFWVALLVGGFFVALSLFGGADSDHGLDADHGAGFVDLFSLRTLFLGSFFFGLTGVTFSLFDRDPVSTLALALALGIVTGVGGNWLLRKVERTSISSTLEPDDLVGKTATVTLPFSEHDRGRVQLVVKGSRTFLVAQAFEGSETAFSPGENVVIVRMNGRIAEVVRPDGALPDRSSQRISH